MMIRRNRSRELSFQASIASPSGFVSPTEVSNS